MGAEPEDVQELTCPRGHHWRLAAEQPSQEASETQRACPECGSLAVTTAPGPGAVSGRDDDAPLPSVPGYEILDELGRGGMAVVYRARQLKPDRIVALKMLRRSAESEEMLARFHREADALASLEHPNIVRVYDVGQADSGDYIALEFVAGGRLDVDGTPFAPKAAAELVQTLARAVHFAHTQGIVHRDLKPANVLLAADGTPKITDFGLARRLDDTMAATRTGEIIGTPHYMAPEQATGVTRNVGPGADVHALGVLLYELLTGRVPYAGSDVLETLMLVASEPPVPPRRFSPAVPRALEVVCMKCLEKRAGGRYETAEALADDLGRWLAGEPIHARPPTKIERAVKWARRRPAAALAAVLAFLLPVLTAGGLWWHSVRMGRELENTRAEFHRAEANLAQAQRAVDRLLGLQTGRLSQLPRTAPLRREMLDWLLSLCRDLQAGNPGQPRLRLQQYRALRQIADIHRLLGDVSESQVVYDRAVQGLRALADRPNADRDAQRELATALNNRGVLRFELGSAGSEDDFRSALDCWKLLGAQADYDSDLTARLAATQANLGVLLTADGQYEAAESLLDSSLRCRKAMADDHPDVVDHRLALAEAFIASGNLQRERCRWDLAAKHFRNAAALASRLVDDTNREPAAIYVLAASQNNLASVLRASGGADEAGELYQSSLDLLNELVAADPSVAAYRELQAMTRLNHALWLSERSASPEAADALREALAAFDALADSPADHAQVRQGTAIGLQQLALYMADSGHQQEAELTLLRGIQLQRQLAERFGERAAPQSLLATFYGTAAELLGRRSDWNEAVRYIQQAVATQQAAIDLAPESPAYRVRLRDHFALQAKILLASGEPRGAAVAADRMASVLPDDWPQDLEAAGLLAQCIPLATTLKGQGRIAGRTIDRFCRDRCVALVRAGIEHGATNLEQLRGTPVYRAIEDSDALDQEDKTEQPPQRP